MTPPRPNRCRAGTRLVVAALLAIIGVSCSDAGSPPTADSVPTVDVSLSGDHLSRCIRVGGGERVVEFDVSVVQNHDQQSLELDLLGVNGQIVSVFGVYPPTAPQRFRARLSTGSYTVELRPGSEQVADGTSVGLKISGATIC
ncbi:MAG: hypothetical protein ABI706_06810 [Ilumatobacteraceae bacterium]